MLLTTQRKIKLFIIGTLGGMIFGEIGFLLGTWVGLNYGSIVLLLCMIAFFMGGAIGTFMIHYWRKKDVQIKTRGSS